MPRTKFVLLVLLVFSAPTVAQKAPLAECCERFQLFNACQPMQIVIGDLSDDAATIGLTREALQLAAESRLRAGRLYTAKTPNVDNIGYYAALYVNVNVVGPAFHITTSYQKGVTDAFGEGGLTGTWDTATTGLHDKNMSFILSILSRHLDKFIAAYLRVNETACSPR